MHNQYATILDSLHAQLASLRRMHFGAKGKQPAGQGEFFAEPVRLQVPAVQTETISSSGKGAAGEKAAFDELERIGEELSDTLDYLPAKLQVVEHVRTVVSGAMRPAPLPRDAPGRPRPFAYLADVLRRLPPHPINRVAELLPFRWRAAS